MNDEEDVVHDRDDVVIDAVGEESLEEHHGAADEEGGGHDPDVVLSVESEQVVVAVLESLHHLGRLLEQLGHGQDIGHEDTGQQSQLVLAVRHQPGDQVDEGEDDEWSDEPVDHHVGSPLYDQTDSRDLEPLSG